MVTEGFSTAAPRRPNAQTFALGDEDMDQARVVVEHVSDTPGGLPAVWQDQLDPNGERTIHLYLRDDLPLRLQDHFRCMCVRDCIPDANWDEFTVLAFDTTMFVAEAV